MKLTHRVRIMSLLVLLLHTTGCGDKNITDRKAIAEAPMAVWKAHDACSLTLQDADDTAIRNLQQRVKQGVNSTAWIEHLGWAYIKKAATSPDENYSQLAELTAICLRKIDANNSEALLINGFVALHKHEFTLAERLARSLIQSRDYWADYALLGDALLAQGDLQAAAQAYQSLMDKRPGPQAYARAAELNWRLGQLSAAREFLQLALTATSPRDRHARAWALTRMAEVNLQAMDYTLAAKHTQQVLAETPDYAPALHVAAKTAMALGEWSQAILFNQQAIAKQALPHFIWLQLEALQAAGGEDQAMKLEELLLDVGETQDPRLLAIYLAGNGRHTQRALNLALHELQHRQDALSHDAAAWAYWSAGEHEKSLAHIEQALNTGLQDARLHYHAGVIYAALNNRQKAEKFLQQAQLRRALLMPSERKHLQETIAATKPQIGHLATSVSTKRHF